MPETVLRPLSWLGFSEFSQPWQAIVGTMCQGECVQDILCCSSRVLWWCSSRLTTLFFSFVLWNRASWCSLGWTQTHLTFFSTRVTGIRYQLWLEEYSVWIILCDLVMRLQWKCTYQWYIMIFRCSRLCVFLICTCVFRIDLKGTAEV